LAQFQRPKGWRNQIKDDLLSESNVQQAVGKIWESIFGDYMGSLLNVDSPKLRCSLIGFALSSAK
jgi:hypothetical protein